MDEKITLCAEVNDGVACVEMGGIVAIRNFDEVYKTWAAEMYSSDMKPKQVFVSGFQQGFMDAIKSIACILKDTAQAQVTVTDETMKGYDDNEI